MRKRLEIAGHRYGRLFVQKRAVNPDYWVCLCDCGTVCEVKQANLRVSLTRSCGCLFREAKAAAPRRPWTEADIAVLSSGATVGVLALELKRNRSEIEKKRRELGIRPDNRQRLSGPRSEPKHTRL